MATKTISITEEAYDRLKAKKDERDSFSDIILKLTSKSMLTDFAGVLSNKEADLLEKKIKENRNRSRLRMENIKKRLNE